MALRQVCPQAKRVSAFRGMRERVRQFGGDLEISSNGKGTRVIAFFPVPSTKIAEPAEPRSSKAVG
jgi:signal transduction histidine kinase